MAALKTISIMFSKIFNEENEPRLLEYAYILFGFGALLTWIGLFLCGMTVDSSYFRAAITYHFDTLFDWVGAFFSFTLTNVMLLAFLAGMLGGICSKILITEGFTVKLSKLKEDKTSYVLYENPFISAFRGTFIFLIILSFQYISSFTDLGSISADTTGSSKSSKNEGAQITDDQNIFIPLLNATRDTAIQDTIKKIWQSRQSAKATSANDSLLDKICILRNRIDSIVNIRNKMGDSPGYSTAIIAANGEINLLRKQIHLPSIASIPGASAVGYFKFAVIISLLAFICGYNPAVFNELLGKFHFMTNKHRK